MSTLIEKHIKKNKINWQKLAQPSHMSHGKESLDPWHTSDLLLGTHLLHGHKHVSVKCFMDTISLNLYNASLR